MNCTCFETVENNLKEKMGDPNAYLNYMLTFPSFERKPVIEGYYRKKKKDGSFQNKEETIQLAYPYCPFCGKKLFNNNEPEATPGSMK